MKYINQKISKLSRKSFVGLCLGLTIIVLALYDLPAETKAWVMMDSMNLSPFQKVMAMTFTWFINTTFWSWIIIAGFVANSIWNKSQNTVPTKTQKSEPTKWSFAERKWQIIFTVLPLIGLNNAFNQYGYVNGIYQKVPYTTEDLVIGFFSGLLIALAIYLITKLSFLILNLIKKK